MPLIAWKDQEDFDKFLSEKKAGFIFKHSTRCGVSRAANQEVRKFLGKNPDVPVGLVLVVENRATSASIANQLKIDHASPQVILVRDGKATWEATHREISASAMEKAWSVS